MIPSNSASYRFSRLQMTFAVANVIFWLYFWVSFALASMPAYERFCMDHCVDLYAFGAHGIGMNVNTLQYPFMRLMEWVEIPSFSLAMFLQNLIGGNSGRGLLFGIVDLFPNNGFTAGSDGFGGRLLWGISVNSYRLIFTVVLSFLQWHFIALFVRRVAIWRTSRERPLV